MFPNEHYVYERAASSHEPRPRVFKHWSEVSERTQILRLTKRRDLQRKPIQSQFGDERPVICVYCHGMRFLQKEAKSK